MNALDVVFKRSQGAAWIQPSGPGTAFLYLNCAGMDGVQKNEGNITPLYCKDESQAGRFRVRDSIQGEPSPVTTSIKIPLGKATNYLFSLKCPFNLQVRYTSCNRQDDPSNWEKIIHLQNARITQRATDALVARAPGEEGEVITTLQLSAEDMFEVSDVEVERQSTVEVTALNDVAFDPTEECESNCGPARSACQKGYIAASAAPYAATANVLKTTDGGGTWAATTTDPFATSEDVSSIAVNGDRVIAARGTADAGNPAEIAYSDDAGVTWTNVNVGSTNSQILKRLKWLARPYLWAVGSSGYIFFSDDGGLTWSTQDAGAGTTQTLNDIDFANVRVGYAVGNSNAVVKTDDGGDSWVAVTGPIVGQALNAVSVVDESTVFIGAANGKLYKTADSGVTWTEVSFPGSGSGSVKDVEFWNSSFGFMIHNTSGNVGRIFRTIDGGKTWTNLAASTSNNGLNRIAVCNQNAAVAVGAFQSTSSVIFSVN